MVIIVISLSFLQRIILSFSNISRTFNTIFGLVLHLAISSLVVVTSCPRFSSIRTPPKKVVLFSHAAWIIKSIHRWAVRPSDQTQWRSMSLCKNTYPGIVTTELSRSEESHCRDRTSAWLNVALHSESCLSPYSDAGCFDAYLEVCRFPLLYNDLPCWF